jgi:hypothetical protein
VLRVPRRDAQFPVSQFSSVRARKPPAEWVRRVRPCGRASVDPCIPRVPGRPDHVQSGSDQDFRLQDQSVQAVAPARRRAGQASATFRVV